MYCTPDLCSVRGRGELVVRITAREGIYSPVKD